jgi:excisionase family DNA binding protein
MGTSAQMTAHAGSPIAASELCSRSTIREEPSMPATPNSHHDDSQLVFTSSQAARYLGVSLATVRRWTDAGFLTGYRTPGGQRRFSREQLDGFIASLQRTDERRPRQRPAERDRQERETATQKPHPRSIRRVA